MNRPAWSELAPGAVSIGGGFWAERRAVNRERAILYQWERYEAAGTIDNFRIAAGLKAGERRGFFYADSDLHKWADAASRILRSGPSPRLEARLEEYVGLMARAQEPDGYLFTYNQLLFPGTRWKNLMIEHELYCLGHFIEAGASRFAGSGRRDLLELALRSARLVVREFREAAPEKTNGHEEIELALLRLYRITREADFLETARALLERRGRIAFFGAKLLAQFASQAARSRDAASRRAAPEGSPGFELGGNLGRREPPFIALRSLPVFLGGSYQQQDRPLREQLEPRGHAVRWAYLMTAAAMLYAEAGDESLLATMAIAWERLVGEKMYVTGGVGALPVIEGFGAPFELDNFFSYSETCAAIGSVLWNRELSLAAGAGDARYADLVEWQLYNAAAVGISTSGDGYFYRNPLASDGEIARRPWYPTACCPSNLSRLWADVDRLAISRSEGALRVEQYLSYTARPEDGVSLAMESDFPWGGRVDISIESTRPLRLFLRIPGWATRCRMTMNGAGYRMLERKPDAVFGPARFAASSYEELSLRAGSTEIGLEFDLPAYALRAHPKVRCDRGRAAIARGPLVYCAEAVDNPGLDLAAAAVDPAVLRPEPDASFPGIDAVALAGPGGGGARAGTAPLRLVPYFLWGNRGAGAMRVFLREGGDDARNLAPRAFRMRGYRWKKKY
jgi:uncharacterized protein